MNQEKIIQAIAAYLEENTIAVQDATVWHLQFKKEIDKLFLTKTAHALAAAIATHLEAGSGWDDAPDWADWRTVDGNGDITYWKDKPEPSKRNDYWTLAKGDRYEQIPHTVKDWKETLQERPR